MIFVDTSVWIEYFRGTSSNLIKNLYQLLEKDQVALSVIVWLELLSGARKSEVLKLKRILSALPRYIPSDTTWNRIENWIQIGLNHGQKFSATDLLIASIASDHHAKLWSLDFDYKRMEKLGFIKLY